MDEDRLRRGLPAIFEQYRQLGEERGYRDTARFGESMGICAGDVAMLLAVEAVANTGLDACVQRDVMRQLAREIADVGVAQMADVGNGHAPEPVSEEDVLCVYRYKTGRYTFSLPLTLGAQIAGAPESETEVLGRWGELQGIVFQIRDDRLGLLEDDASTGKPSGSDITADKQTLYRLLLGERAPGTEWEPVLGLFGRNALSDADIQAVRNALESLSVLKDVDARAQQMADEANELLKDLATLSEGGRETLESIAKYNSTRRH
jgi:geranylgeranyl diphosphate synthase type I